MISNDIKELAAALAKVQAKLVPAPKDSENPFFKSKYADLVSVWDACRGPLTENGFSVTQLIKGDRLDTYLLHSSGEYVVASCPILAKDQSAQAMGSAITYARRYSLAAVVGVVADDDDGEAAKGSPAPVPAKKPAPAPAPKPSAPVPPTDKDLSATKAARYVGEFDSAATNEEVKGIGQRANADKPSFTPDDWVKVLTAANNALARTKGVPK